MKFWHYISLALAILCLILWYTRPEPENTYDAERQHLQTISDGLFEKLSKYQDSLKVSEIAIRSLETRLKDQQERTARIRERKPVFKPAEVTNLDSTFRKVYPTPDSVLFASGSKDTYVVSVQKQVYENLIEKDYYQELATSMDSTLQVFASLVAQKDGLIRNQKLVIEGKDDIIENLLKTQVVDMEEITMLRKKKKRNSILIKVGIPAAIIGGFVLGSKF